MVDSPVNEMASKPKLDQPPPHPPFKKAKTLMSHEAAESPEYETDEEGLGAAASDPMVRGLKGLKQCDMGVQAIVAAFPQLSATLSQFFSAIQPLVMQAITGSGMAGGVPPGMGMQPPPGLMPPQPMGPPPMGAAPPPQGGMMGM